MDEPKYLRERQERDMQALRDRVRHMADQVSRQLEDSVAAFADHNSKLAYKVVLRDRAIDVLEQHIDRLCQEFLVRHMPVSEHLRFVVAVAKVNSELERIGDYAEAIARRVVTVARAEETPSRERILDMATLAFQMLREAVDAFLAGDAEAALKTLKHDTQVDLLNSAIFDALADPDDRSDLRIRFALVGLINRIERVADRACNIAEEAVYVVRGDVLRHLPREDLRVLFVCDHNACRSQMAEGMARALALPNVILNSAGADPTAIDEHCVAYLAKRGIDISRQRPKGLGEVGNLEDFNIVVTLSQAAEEAVPEVPYGSVHLNWSIDDPGKVQGTPEEIEAAYEAAFSRLKSKIEALMDGLGGAYEGEETP